MTTTDLGAPTTASAPGRLFGPGPDTRLGVPPVEQVCPGGLMEVITRQQTALGPRTYLRHARHGGRLSFDTLMENVVSWGRWLDDHEIGPGERVALVIADPLAFATVYLAIVANGRWAVPCDPGSPDSPLVASLARMKPVAVISDRPTRPETMAPWFGTDVSRTSPGRPSSPVAASEPAEPSPTCWHGGTILASSGSTGVPKVIVLHQRQLLHAARAVAQHHRLDSNDVGFNPLPLFHVNAEVVGLLASLWAGSELVLDDRFHRTGFWEVMGRHQVTWINAVPAIINRLATTGPVASIPRSIRFVRSASAPLPLATLRRFEEATGLPVLETYGMTEAAGQITANPIDGPRKPGSVGRPVDIELRIVVEPDVGRSGSSSRAGIDQTGHVEIRGRSVDPHPGPFIGEGPGGNAGRVGGGWLRTGDLGRLDADGYLFLQGRRDDVINRGGEKVFPREIEEAISEDPRVIDTAVVAEDDDALGQVPVAYLTVDGVTGRADARRALAVAGDVRDRLSESLPRSKRPSALHVVTGLAATATGKVVRRSLPADDLETVVTLDLR